MLIDFLGYTSSPSSNINIYIYIYNQFSDKVSKHGSFTESEIIHQIDFTIDNCFISYNHLVFKQTIGIPMGTNCASHLANIFLHIYEKTFICKLMEEGNIEYISKLGTIFRYQDDLINFGNSNIANDILNNIYPKDMIIKNTNLSSNSVTYLDLAITMKDDQYHYTSYDKRKDFNFPRFCSFPPSLYSVYATGSVNLHAWV